MPTQLLDSTLHTVHAMQHNVVLYSGQACVASMMTPHRERERSHTSVNAFV